MADNKVSALRKIVESLDINKPVEELKANTIANIESLEIIGRDKHRMKVELMRCPTSLKIVQYMFNALLKYEGNGVIRY